MYPLFYMVILALGDKLCGNAYPHNVRSCLLYTSLDTINEYQSQGMLTIDGKLKLGKALGDGLEHREFYADAASIEQIVKKLYPLMEQPKTNK